MTQSIKLKQQAIWYALGSVLLYATATPCTKLILQHIAPIMLAGLLHLGAGIGLTCMWLFQNLRGHKNAVDFLPNRKDWPWLIWPVLAGGILSALCLMMAMNITRASCVSLLINLEIVFTVLMARLVFKEHLSTRAILGLLAILFGSVCLSWHADLSVSWPSILLMSACCLCWAIDGNFTAQMKNSEPVQIARCRGLIAGTFNFCLALMLGCHLPNVGIMSCAIVMGIVAQGIGLSLYIVALHQLGVARTTAYFATEPFLGALLSMLILHEPLSANIMLAAVLMGLGVWLHFSEKHEHEHPYSPMN